MVSMVWRLRFLFRCGSMKKESTVKEIAVFGGGCFWCTEAVFKMLRGVSVVKPGYAGGTVPNLTDDQVCGGRTGHAEVIYLEYDPAQVKYRDLLTVFSARMIRRRSIDRAMTSARSTARSSSTRRRSRRLMLRR